MAAPVLQAHTMSRLNKTKSAAGGVPLAQFMVVSGTGITSWAITLSGGTASHWNLPVDGSSPTPTSTGDTAELNGGPYTFSVTATNADGTSAPAVLTINVPSARVGYTVSTPSQIDSGLRLGTEGGLSIKSQLGGRYVEIARGAETQFPQGTSATFRGFNLHTGSFTVTSEDTANRSAVARVFCNGGCSRIIFTEFNIYSSIAAHGPDVGLPPDGGNSQNPALIAVAYNSSFGTCTDLTFDDILLGAPVSASFASQWLSGVDIAGQSTSPYTPATGITVSNVTMDRVKDGIRTSRVNSSTFENLTIDRFCSNSMFLGGFTNNTFRNIIVVRPTLNRADVGDHRDFMQVGSGAPTSNYDSFVFDQIYLISADGNSASQGPFFDDVSYYQSLVTGFTQNNQSLSNIFADPCVQQGIHMDGGSGWDVARATIIRGECAEAQNIDASGNYVAATFITPVVDGSNYVSTTGIVSKSAVQSFAADVLTGNFPDITTLNSDLSSITALPAGGTGFTSQNEAVRAAYYDEFFQEPGRAIDYPNLTPAQILAEIRLAYAPVLLGPLRNADGTYNGAFFPDGTNNDGTVYQATPPSEITSSAPVSAATVGEPVTVTFQLDAAANLAVTITPAVGGVSGSFDPATVLIPVSSASGTTDFTASSAGTSSITATDDRGLTDPAALVLTISAAVAAPTVYTQSLSSAAIPLGGAIDITYVLDAAATADVTITPASTLAGAFSTATVVIPFGQTTGAVTFIPSVNGSGVLSAINDRSLANPSNAAFSVSRTIRGQLIKMGIRA